ncbi:MAG: hypothetical protein JO372_07130 [Solirubrobacterales bacterium]|nr:hypothetical protein [Solirubrobacterales bacterium]
MQFPPPPTVIGPEGPVAGGGLPEPPEAACEVEVLSAKAGELELGDVKELGSSAAAAPAVREALFAAALVV